MRNDKGRFILRLPGEGNMEMPLIAKGRRKLASVAYLIAKLAKILVKIAQQGTQVIIATHSLFLLKELDLQLEFKQLKKGSAEKLEGRFFALAQAERYEESVIARDTVGGRGNT